MGNLDLGTLIVAGIAGIGLIQLGMWIVVMIRHRGDDVLRLVLVESPSTQAEIEAGSRFSAPEHN